MNTDHDLGGPTTPLPDSIPCEPLSYKSLQRESEKRLRRCLVPRDGATKWTDSRGQRYERLKNGQIVKVSE